MPSSVYFRFPVACPNCGNAIAADESRVYTSGLGNHYTDTVAIGDVLSIEDSDFEDSFLTLRRPIPTDPIVVSIELWTCPRCETVRWARLELAKLGNSRYRFQRAGLVSLSKVTLDEANFVSAKLYAWTPQPGDDIERLQHLRDQLP